MKTNICGSLTPKINVEKVQTQHNVGTGLPVQQLLVPSFGINGSKTALRVKTATLVHKSAVRRVPTKGGSSEEDITLRRSGLNSFVGTDKRK